jgi:hypothetical protein
MSEINLKRGELFAILQQVAFLKSMIKDPASSLGADSSIGLGRGEDGDLVLDPFGDTNCLQSASSTTLSKNLDY